MRKNIKKIVIGAAVVLTAALLFIVVSMATEIIAERQNPTGSKYDRFVKKVESQSETNDEFNEVMFNYKFIELGYEMPPENLTYIQDLVLKDYNAQDVICAYLFWTDTNENIEIVEQMCEYKKNQEFEDDFWEESAFNFITKEKYGVLDLDGIYEYYAKGLVRDDISAANILSRKGVLTISQILDKRVEGAAFESIEKQVTNELKTKGKPGRVDRNRTEGREDELQEQIIKQLRVEKNYKKSEEDEKINGKAYKQLRDEIRGKVKISDNEIESFIDEGYSYTDILNAAEFESKDKAKGMRNRLSDMQKYDSVVEYEKAVVSK